MLQQLRNLWILLKPTFQLKHALTIDKGPQNGHKLSMRNTVERPGRRIHPLLEQDQELGGQLIIFKLSLQSQTLNQVAHGAEIFF